MATSFVYCKGNNPSLFKHGLDMYEVPGKKIVHQGINFSFEFACEYFQIFVGSDIITDADDITFLFCDFLLY